MNARVEGGFPRRVILRRALQSLIAAPIIAAIFLLALMAAETAPTAPIVRHLAEDQEMFAAPRLRVLTGRKIDVGTECLGVSFALPPSAIEQSLVERAVRSRVLTSCPALTSYIAGGALSEADVDDYHRYWHGYAAISRPLLALMPYRDLRMLTFNIVLGLFLALGYRLAKDFSLKFAFAVLLPFYIVNFAGFFILWTKAVSWIVMLGGGLYFASSRRPYQGDPLLAFFLLGALTAYFDLLTTPLMIFGVPAYIYFFYLMRGGAAPGPRGLFLRLAAIGGFWFAGYAGLWTAKFTLSTAVIGPAAIGDVVSAAANRINGDWDSVKHFLGAATLENLEAFKPIWGGAAFALFFILPFVRARRRRAALLLARRAPVFVMLAIAPFIWFEVLSNHSQIHGLFTHAILVLTFIPLSLILFEEAGRLVGAAEKQHSKEKRP
jgi:hypothetical protein